MSSAYEYVTQSERSSSSDPRSLRLPKTLISGLTLIEGGLATFDKITDYDTTYEYIDSDGVVIREVSFADISDKSPDRLLIREKIASYVNQVREHPDWNGPSVVVNELGQRELVHNNPVSQEMYDAMPAMASWRKELVPSAVALYPLQYPEEDYLPNGVEIDDQTKSMFTNSLDGIGIRTRAKIMSYIAASHINEYGVTNWTSLACGAAVPVLNAIQDNHDRIDDVNLRLVDFDPEALQFAQGLARSRDLTEGKDFELMNRDLARELIVSDRLVGELGEESMDLVDALGIFEYFKEKHSVRFLTNAYKLVKPGGALVAANMLVTHPEIQFNQQVIGWPTIYPRTIDSLKSIIHKSGIDLENVSITIPSDGIYAVFEIKK